MTGSELKSKLIKNNLVKSNLGLKTCEPFDGAHMSDAIYSHALHIIGFEFDGTACFRKGTVKGPNACRAVSDGIESYSPYLDLDTEDLPTYYDLGNLQNRSEDGEQDWGRATEQYLNLFDMDLQEHSVRTLLIGGEHSVSYAPIRRYLESYPDLVLIHLDAHADLRDGYLGYHHSHASIIRRSLDHFESGHSLIQYGIRSGTKEEYQWMRKEKTLCTSRKEFLERVQELNAHRPVYLTLDLDYFDPCYLPGTGTPEAGGEDFHSFISLMKVLKEKNLVGADVVELSPEIDPTGNSDVFAAKVLREIILLLGAP